MEAAELTELSNNGAETQSCSGKDLAKHTLVGDYLKLADKAPPNPGSFSQEQSISGKSADAKVEETGSGTGAAETRFKGELYLIGGVADTTWNDLLLRLPRNAKVVAVGLAAEDGDAASLELAQDFEAGGIKPENITIISNNQAPAGSKYHWSRNLPDRQDLIYFGGGDQSVLKERFTQLDKLKAALQNGTIVAGNSAGTAVMSTEMITGGDAGDLTHAPGFALLPWAITDTHVHQRHREERDVSALYEIAKGKLPVLGIDADTRVLLRWQANHLVAEVGGDGSVRVFKGTGSDLDISSSRKVEPQLTYGTDGAGKGKAALVWELKAGDKFILH